MVTLGHAICAACSGVLRACFCTGAVRATYLRRTGRRNGDNVMLLGYVNFVRHVCTSEHMERVVASGGRGWVLEKTEEYFDINLT